MGISYLIFYLSILVFRGLLDLSYVVFVSPVFTYSGFYLDFNLLVYIVSWLLYLTGMIFVNKDLERVSDYFFILALLSLVAPLTSFYGLTGGALKPVIVSMASISFMYVFVRKVSLSFVKLPFIKRGFGKAVKLSVCMVLVLIAWYFISGAVKYFNLDLTKVYEYRKLSSDLANVGVMAYVNGWVFQVFSIFLFSCSLLYRRFFYTILIFLIQVFFYGVSAHKSVLFYPAMIFGIWFYFRKTRSLFVVPVLFSMVVVSCLFFYVFFNEIAYASMFIRRVFYIPTLFSYDFFEFFENNPHVIWSNSILSSILSYPYDNSVPLVIGDYNGTGAAANNGFIPSGYAHAGLLGVFIYTLIFGLILKWVDVISCDLPLWFSLCIVIVPYRSALISSDLFTVMLTHGLLVAIFLLLVSRSKSNCDA